MGRLLFGVSNVRKQLALAPLLATFSAEVTAHDEAFLLQFQQGMVCFPRVQLQRFAEFGYCDRDKNFEAAA